MNQTLITELASKKDRAILKMIFQYKAISRPELLELSKLKTATLYRTIDSLLSKNLALVAKTDESASVGRPSDILTINGDYAHIYCILVRRTESTIAIVDFAGEIIYEKSFDCSDMTPAQVVSHCYELYNSSVKQLGIDEKKLLGIGISTFGEPVYSIDEEALPVYPGFKWGKYDVVSELEKTFKKPVWFEYNARSAVEGFYLNKYFRDYSNLAYIIIDEGIGIGIIIDGTMIRGNTRGDTQIVNGLGHMVVDINGPKCICGKYGCMETRVSRLAILSSAIAELKLGKESVLRDKMQSLTWLDVCKAGDSGDKLASYVIENAAHIFSIGLENFLNILDINLIIIGGGVPENSKLFYNTVKNKFNKINPRLKIEIDSNEKEMILKGCAASFVLDLLK